MVISRDAEVKERSGWLYVYVYFIRRGPKCICSGTNPTGCMGGSTHPNHLQLQAHQLQNVFLQSPNVHNIFLQIGKFIFGHQPVWILPAAAAGGSPVRAASITGTLLSSQPAELQHPSFFSFPEWRDKLIIICQLSLALVNIW